MRNGTVDGLNANPRGVCHRCLIVELLTGETISIPFEGKTTCSAIWNRVEGELVARGVVHPQIFGLAIKSGSDWVFVDPDAKLSNYYPNICKEGKSTSQNHNGSNVGKHPAFYCRVHFYLDAIPQNFDVVSLHHYYLQLRQNLISAPRFPPASIVQPVAYSFQFELGDWRPGQDFPRWVSSQSLISSLGSSLTRAHQALAGLGKEAARLAFIRAVMPQYNMHLFGMTLKTKEEKYAPAWIGVTPKGIEVYQNAVGCNEIPEQPRLTFLWANITKLYFERKKYGIRGKAFPWANSTQKLSFTASSESVPQHLLHLCRSTHQFHLSNHKILLTAEHLNSHKSSVSSTGGESSCNSTLLSSSSRNDDKMLDLSLWADGLLLTGESSEHQRVSVISNASSNTTSGIVSDRVYSLDGSEAEDLELREIPDCCTERAHNGCNRNSTSLESLSQRHPPPPTRPHNHNLSRIHSTTAPLINSNGHGNSNSKCTGPVDQSEEDNDAKYWYCDSDCEDCDDSGPCRSVLVRTIGEKSRCAGHCECNSCVTDEDEVDGMDVGLCDKSKHHPVHHHHHNTPSMASESTLKAVDISSDNDCNGNAKHDSGSSASATTKTKSVKSGYNPTTKGKFDKVQTIPSVESDGTCDGEIEEYKLEDEHVYGEISEDPGPLKTTSNTNNSKVKMKTDSDIDDQQYSTIEEESVNVKSPKAKPRYSCIKSVEPQKSGCKCRIKDKCCNPNKKMCKKGDKNSCPKECKKCYSNSGSSQPVSLKENGLTPKVASLKCLRKPRPSCSSNIRRHISNRHKGEINFAELPPVNYVEFGEKLQQGKYPSTRTVSDNFDTDSDYVQLPPLTWYPPRLPPKKANGLKLWKCVSNSKPENLNLKPPKPKPKVSSSHSSLSPLPPQVNLSTLPRRKSELSGDDNNPGSNINNHNRSNLISGKVSRSTTALNLVGHAKPEPPPKPRKSLADLSSVGDPTNNSNNDGSAVDARFIATKPQILIQTAYATTAPVAIPSQAQVLIRGTKQTLGPIPLGPGNNSHPVLQHSQSVDNIYDTVASEEPFVPSITPPPYSTSVTKTSAPLIIRPNNYIDVHASSVKNKLSTKPSNAIPTSTITNYGHGPVGKNVANRCGSVPNNLNNFLIGFGLENLKPLSRTPIVQPGATSCLTLNNQNIMHPGNVTGHSKLLTSHAQCPGNMSKISAKGPLPLPIPCTTTAGCNSGNPRFTTVYTNQLTRSQIQQFKAQLYSDLDYVIFPPKDPRVSQQEYFDSKSLSYTTVSSTNSNPMLTTSAYQINDIPPPYLPPPPPYPSTVAGSASLSAVSSVPPPLPRKNPKLSSNSRPLPPINNNSSTNVTSSLSNHSIAAATVTSSPYHHNSFQSLYNPGSNNSHCSSSQYGYYGAGVGLNSENLQRFLSTQSFAGSNASSTPIYYPSSTQSAPPLPPYKPSGQVIIENGMRKAVQQLMTSRNNAGLTASDERLRMNMKLCRSEESLYSQPTTETEEHLQAIYNLPPPPPYKRTTNTHSLNFSTRQETISAAELDLAHLRARCHALELPFLRALCSEGELLNKNTNTKALIQAAKNRIRPTAHAHPKFSLPKNPLPIPAKPSATQNHSNVHPT